MVEEKERKEREKGAKSKKNYFNCGREKEKKERERRECMRKEEVEREVIGWIERKAWAEREIKRYIEIISMMRLDEEKYNILYLGLQAGYVLGISAGEGMFPMSKIKQWRDEIIGSVREE